jgi:regulator of sigma E protease
MLGILQNVGAFVFIFGIVVFVHELGHFIAAKLTGVYAPKFSVGFGPGPSKKWGETQYILGLIPLGGYVRMASREDEATAFLEGGSEEAAARAQAAGDAPRPKDWDPNGMIPFGPNPVPEHRWFESKSLPQRLVILLAGVTMNALLALGVLFGIALHDGRNTLETRVVGGVQEMEGSEALRAALRHGDTITAIQGQAVDNWNDVERAMLTSSGDSLRFTTNRGDIVVEAGTSSGPRRQVYMIALEPYSPPVIGILSPAGPAAKAGLQVGDSIVSIGGESVRTFGDLVTRVSASPGKPIEIDVIRDAVPLHFTVEPAPTVIDSPDGKGKQTVGRIGAGERRSVRHEELTVGQAFVEGAQRTKDMAGSIFAILGGLIKRDIAMDQLGGPIMIAQQAASAAQAGMRELLGLLALLSINLAVLNLLPIPVLDGGQVALQVAESVKGRPFSARTRQYILGTGVALVLLLMLVVSYNDIIRLISS